VRDRSYWWYVPCFPLIVVVDAAAFAVPLAALVVAYVVLARPAWFREWVGRLYREGPR
jgi:hypothetical protein